MGYSVVEEKGAWWIVRPDGKRMLSKGVDCVGTGVEADKYNPAKPEYCPSRQPGFVFEKWRDRTVARFKSWGFNTIAGWSDARMAGAGGMAMTPVLHIGIMTGAPWVDMWVPEIEKQAAELARKLTAPYRNLPGVLGYFLDNEFGWGDEYFLGLALGWDGKSPGKKLLVKTLKELYGGDFTALRADFDTSAKDWDGLASDVKAVRRPGRGHRAIDAWVYVAARRYYELFSRVVREADPGKLILGDRFRQYCPQAVARAARGVIDVISTNFEARTTDGWISPVYFETMHELSGLPVVVGEFYATARQNRSGNRNSGGEFTLTDTQAERARAAAAQVRGFAAFPFVVGWHWFQFTDEPTFGRGDGEDYNMGLVDIFDEPYAEITAALGSANRAADLMHARKRTAPAVALPLPVRRQKGLVADGRLDDWDKTSPVPRGLLSTPAPLVPFADLFLAWDERNLWLAARPYDFTIPQAAAERHDPSTWGEFHRITVKAGRFTLKAATGLTKADGYGENGRQTLFAEPPPAGLSSAAVSSRVDAWHYVWEIAIPAKSLGKKSLRKGDRFKLAVEVENRGDFEKMSLGRGGKGLDIVLK